LIAKKFPRLRIPPSFLFGARHFGTGVLIATAFVHLLPTAFISLTDQCLPKFWNETYPAMAGAIAMVAVFFVTIVEMVFTRGLCKGNYSDDDQKAAKLEAGKNKCCTGEETDTGKRQEWEGRRVGTPGSEEIGGKGGVGKMGFGMAGRRRSRSHSVGQGLQKYEEMEKGRHYQPTTATLPDNNDSSLTVIGTSGPDDTIVELRNNFSNAREECAVEDEEDRHSVAVKTFKSIPGVNDMTPEQLHKKALLQCALLEMGILFHSVFIGMALSVTGGSGFVVLLIAIIFHRSFPLSLTMFLLGAD
jgi:solute carrier family 39 (zinc transporter), member 1/2/3